MTAGTKRRGATRQICLCAAIAVASLCFAMAERALPFAARRPAGPEAGWSAYNGDQANTHYSPLRQINTKNVTQLRQVWRYDAGTGGLQTNPLVVGGTLYAYTSRLHVVALDAATGEKRWTFDPDEEGEQPSRGFSWWSDGRQQRLFAFAMNGVYAINPSDGTRIRSFGESGKIDLRKNLDTADFKSLSVVATTPGIIFRNLLIVGFRTAETKPAARGDIRAYDVISGRLIWSFHTIPHPGEKGYETWPAGAWSKSGAANNWCGMALDEKRGIVYVPTGSAAADFYGADRHGPDLYANTLLALKADTGKELWHFQAVHHDIWDRDLPSPPTLATIRRDGRDVDVVAQPTKHGFLFVLDRVSGKPVFPITERPFPASSVHGESSFATQPTVALPEPFARQSLTEDLLTTRTAAAHEAVLKEFRALKGGTPFVPFGVDTQTIVFPGFDGGAEWGGSAVNRSGVLFLNANDVPWTGGLTKSVTASDPGASLYQSQCALCHGANRRGSPPEFPSLVDITKRMTAAKIQSTVHNGAGRMPSFPSLDGTRFNQLLSYLERPPDAASPGAIVDSGPALSADAQNGARLYQQNCAMCHGARREGAPSNYPSLLGVRTRLNDREILRRVQEGWGRMPAFPQLTQREQQQLLEFLGPAVRMGNPDQKELSSKSVEDDAYRFTGYKHFLDPDGYPAVKPPWGTLNAIDLSTGAYLWKVPLGEYPELTKEGLPTTGSENYGGPVVTAGGLVFIGATVYDRKFRAFDVSTGKVLWTADLPYAGVATPATYSVHGRQYVVIATSGQRDRKGPSGAAYVAFALP